MGETTTMTRAITDGERFLRDYHRRHPGITPALFGGAVAPDGRGSYRILADLTAGRARVLDLACGNGPLLELLVAPGRDVVGLDMTDGELAAARRRPALATTPLVRAMAQDLPFRADSFDACVSHMAFMLMRDPEAVAAELARVLVPGGLLAVVVGGPERAGAHGLIRSAFRELVDGLPQRYRLPRIGDRRTYTREGMDEILGPAGFAPVDLDVVPITGRGTVDEAWQVATSFYDFDLLDDDMVAGLRERFDAEAPGIAEPDGGVSWTITVSVFTTSLSARAPTAG